MLSKEFENVHPHEILISLRRGAEDFRETTRIISNHKIAVFNKNVLRREYRGQFS